MPHAKFPPFLTLPLILPLLVCFTPARALLAHTQTPSERSFADHVVISEIYYNPEDEYDSEFIEFYNPTDAPVDLTEWDFQEKDGGKWKNFATSTDVQNVLVIPPGGFLLLVDGGWSENRDDPDWPEGDVIDELSLLNGESTVRVRNPDGMIVDSVTYLGEAKDRQSVERKARADSTTTSMRDSSSDGRRGNAYDTDDFESDFVGPLTPDPANTNSPVEFLEEPPPLTLTAEGLNLPADGMSQTPIRIDNGFPGIEVLLRSEFGDLSEEKVVLDERGEAVVSLTAPQDPGSTIVIAEGRGRLSGTAVYFHGPDGIEVESSRTLIVEPGTEGGEIDAYGEMKTEVVATKKASRGDRYSAVSVGEYPENPTAVHGLSGVHDRYLNLHAVNPDALSELTVTVYLESWPDLPRARYWDGPGRRWKSFSHIEPSEEENSLTVKVDGATDPGLEDVLDMKIAAGGLDLAEISVEESGWNMVSLPLEPELNDPGSVFSGADPSSISRWDPTLDGGEGGYITSEGYYNEVHACEGSWVYVSGEKVPLKFSVPGIYDGSVRIDLSEEGWHQIGVPFDYAWEEVGVERTGSERTFSVGEAADKGLIWGYFWEWSPDRGRYYPHREGILEAGKGYWVNVKDDGLQLVVPYGVPPGVPESNTHELTGLGTPSALDLPDPPAPPPGPDLEPEEEIACYATPNPASYDLPVTFTTTASDVHEMRVVLSDLSGRRIYDSGFVRSSGVEWDLRDQEGRVPPNGLYLYRVFLVGQDGRRINGQVRKLLLVG
ncbi:MAG: lamin tail domain-containing protein [Candidatus Acetothermia bacterium]